jgi:hypothetical protein
MSSRSHGSRKTARRPTHNVTNPTVILRRKQKARVAGILAQIEDVKRQQEYLAEQQKILERQLAEFVTADDKNLFSGDFTEQSKLNALERYFTNLDYENGVKDEDFFSW